MTNQTNKEIVEGLNEYIEYLEKEFPSISEDFELGMLLDQIAVTIIYLRQSYAILSTVGRVAHEYLTKVANENPENTQDMKIRLGDLEL